MGSLCRQDSLEGTCKHQLVVELLLMSFVLQGGPQVRRTLGNQIRGARFNVLLTTYEYVMKDKGQLAKVTMATLVTTH